MVQFVSTHALADCSNTTSEKPLESPETSEEFDARNNCTRWAPVCKSRWLAKRGGNTCWHSYDRSRHSPARRFCGFPSRLNLLDECFQIVNILQQRRGVRNR